MAEEMLNELLGDFTNNSNDEIRRVQQKRSDSALSASATSSGSADDVDSDSNHILTYKRWIWVHADPYTINPGIRIEGPKIQLLQSKILSKRNPKNDEKPFLEEEVEDHNQPIGSPHTGQYPTFHL